MKHYLEINEYIKVCYEISKHRYEGLNDIEIIFQIRNEIIEAKKAYYLPEDWEYLYNISKNKQEYFKKNIKDSFPCEISDIFIFLCSFLGHKGYEFNKMFDIHHTTIRESEDYHIKKLTEIDWNLQSLIKEDETLIPKPVLLHTIRKIILDLFKIARYKEFDLVKFIDLKNEYNKVR